MTDIYTRLGYDDYKSLERQMKKFDETIHTTATGYYHRSIRLSIGPHLTLEFHGPTVKAAEQ